MATKDALPKKDTGSRITLARSSPVLHSLVEPHTHEWVELAIAEELVLVTVPDDDEGTLGFIICGFERPSPFLFNDV